MTPEEIISEKLSRLNSIPDKLITSVEVAQRDLYTRLLELFSSLEKKGDVIVKSKKNLALIDEIMSGLKTELESKDGVYYKAVKSFTDEIKTQQLLTDDYFSAILTDGGGSFSKEVAITTRKQAANLLLGSSIEGSFFNPVREQITNSIISGASYKETVTSLREVIIGNDKLEGSLQKHVKQIAHDSFAIADRSYTATVSDELGIEWFNYRGSEIKTSRPFCKERHGRYFHKNEIEAWGNGDKTTGMRTPDVTGHWTGEMLGTNNKTIFSFAGGYNCRHSISPVTIARVPQADIERAISQGFYKPKK